MKRLREELMRADRLGPSWAPSLLPWTKKTKRGHKFDEDDWRHQFDTSGSHLGDNRVQWRWQESNEHGERELCYINSTRVPEHLEHWITNPNGIKRERDRKLVKLMHRKQHESKKHARTQSNRMIRLLNEEQSAAGPEQTSTGTDTASSEVLNIAQQESSYAHVMTQLHNASVRQQRVARVVFDAVGKHLQRTYLDKHVVLRKAGFHVKWVHVTRDLLKANLYWGCTAGHEEQVKVELKSLATPLRSDVTHTIKLKYSPELIFIRDTNSQKQVQVYKLLEDVEARLDKQK
jgi:ribosome-binding factor A